MQKNVGCKLQIEPNSQPKERNEGLGFQRRCSWTTGPYRRVSTRGEFTEWIEFFLEAVRASAVETMNKISAIEELLVEFQNRVASASQSHNPLRLIETLRVSPFTTIPDAARQLQTSSQVARNAVKVLVDQQILAPLNVQKKTRKRGKNPDYYFCPELFEIVNR